MIGGMGWDGMVRYNTYILPNCFPVTQQVLGAAGVFAVCVAHVCVFVDILFWRSRARCVSGRYELVHPCLRRENQTKNPEVVFCAECQFALECARAIS